MKNAPCSAPFNNLYFGNRGAVMACCANKLHVLGTYPHQSIAEIWQGHRANELRQAMAQNIFDLGCTGCRLFLENSNRSGAPLTAYDNIHQSDPQWPARLEFELTNTCNLECIMCTGEYSSSIRERRERKPPLHDPYDRCFLLQLKDFIPHLIAVRFVGGEPFLIQKYFDIMDMIAEINPSIEIFIQTEPY
ncbi:MAG: SPASM domain-containing protein [Bacteroidetes bacterium]|nr:SPASM domain-containing protein [Bacteroidota bacterium]